MNLIDSLEFYAMLSNTNDITAMLQDYVLDNRLSRDFMNKVIIKELGNCRPLSTNTTVFKFQLEEFFQKYELNISKLLDTVFAEYNPLDNKNITEIEHRDSTGNIENTDKYGTKIILDAENKVSAYDSSTYQPKNKDDSTNTTTHNGETTSDIESTVDTEKTITGKDNNVSYQELIAQERELANFNIYNWIIGNMRKELFLLIY